MDISQSSANEIAEQLKKEFPDSAIGITGCRSSGSPYPYCEFDYIIVQKDAKMIERRIFKKNYIELLYLDNDSVQNLSDDKIVLALLDMNVISDPQWDLIPIVYKIKADVTKHLQKYAKNSLFKSLSTLGRFQDSIDAGNSLDASFWLLSSSNSFAKAIIAMNGKVPHNSHIMSEFRNQLAVVPDMFDIWSESSGINLATKVAVSRRLDALREILQIGSIFSNSSIFSDPKHVYMFAEAKSNYLVKSHEILDAYCYLGLEITIAIEELYEFKCRIKDKPPLFHKMFSQLAINEKPLKKISMQTIRLIGINSDEQMTIKQSIRLKNLIQKVIKNISNK